MGCARTVCVRNLSVTHLAHTFLSLEKSLERNPIGRVGCAAPRIREAAPRWRTLCGWVRTIRLAFGNEFNALGRRIGISAQGVRKLEMAKPKAALRCEPFQACSRIGLRRSVCACATNEFD